MALKENERLPKLTKLLYGAGDIGFSLTDTVLGVLFAIFLTDVVGLRPSLAAGAVFIGPLSATAFGDYVAGTNHVLPTGGSARYSSPLSVHTFLRRSSYVEMTERAVEELAPRVAEIAKSEGLYFHRLSAELRLRKR